MFINHIGCWCVMPLKVLELFAGVGGFRLALEAVKDANGDQAFEIVASNQWEPETPTVQHAAEIYKTRWGLNKSTQQGDVFGCKNSKELFFQKDIKDLDARDIPNHDLLVGGFPCQDYSVAKGSRGKGIKGKKGVLWWEILRIVKAKKPKHLLLENVDRLLRSPVKQRGRDMAIMLATLDECHYAVEWREINAATYGFPQRRNRVFLLAHKKGTPQYKAIVHRSFNPAGWLTNSGTFARGFPVHPVLDVGLEKHLLNAEGSLDQLSEKFNQNEDGKARSPFLGAGIMVKNQFWTMKLVPIPSCKSTNLRDVLTTPSKVHDDFIVSAQDVVKEKGWLYYKGAKKHKRKDPETEFEYEYNEGGMHFPDRLDAPARTIITGEGGRTPTRTKHIIPFRPTSAQRKRLMLNSDACNTIRAQVGLRSNEWLRRLVPEELEQLNGFPPGHTAGLSDNKRAFLMGNALVVGVVQKIGSSLVSY